MKKSVLALAVLGTFASIASAQSTVTIYGRLDQAYGKKQGPSGSTTGPGTPSGIFDPSGSRIGFKGTEDLGGGLKASFNLEHRFYADDGSTPYSVPGVVSAPAGNFWGARSIVGLEGGFGKVMVGREYTAAFLAVENPMDPYKGDTIATIKPMSLGGGAEPARFSNSINYTYSAQGFTGIGSWAAKEATVGKNAYSLAGNYTAGPIFVGVGHTNSYDTDDKWTILGSTFDFGVVKPGLLFGTGTNAAAEKIRSWAITAVAPLGNGQFRALYGQRKNKATNAQEVKQLSGGYWYSLSKRTTVYVDVVRDNGTFAYGHTKGYELGLKHEF